MSPDHFFDPHECPSERSIRGQKGGLRADKRHLHSGLSIVSVLFTMRILVKKKCCFKHFLINFISFSEFQMDSSTNIC